MHPKSLVRAYALFLTTIIFSCSTQHPSLVKSKYKPSTVDGVIADITTPNAKSRGCSNSASGYKYRNNKYIIDDLWSSSNNPIIPRPLYGTCTKRQIIEGEFALMERSLLTFVGDLCRADLTLIANTDFSAIGPSMRRYTKIVLQETHEEIKNKPLDQLSGGTYYYRKNHKHAIADEVVQFAAANWYVQEDGGLPLHLIAEVIKKSCGHRPPDRVKLVGRYQDYSGIDFKPTGKKMRKYHARNIYSGTIIFDGTPRLVHDNQKLANFYQAIEIQIALDAAEARERHRQEYERKQEKMAMGLLFFLMGAAAVEQTAPCNDPKLRPEQRPTDCFFKH